jgi:predicted Zn-dependent protease
MARNTSKSGLLENHYSRENESDADRYAFERMIQAGIDPAHFSRIMARIKVRVGITLY